jgi:DNA replication protein DnaC
MRIKEEVSLRRLLIAGERLVQQVIEDRAIQLGFGAIVVEKRIERIDRALLNELVTLRFLQTHHHVALVGPVGVGKTFLAHALGHIACRRGHSVLALRTDALLKTLKHARLTQSHEAELRKLLAVDLLILDDFALDAMEAAESRDAYEVFLERDRAGSLIVASNRGPDEWLATFADPVRAQSALDRFTSRAYDLVIEGESYRTRLKPRLPAPGRKGAPAPA